MIICITTKELASFLIERNCQNVLIAYTYIITAICSSYSRCPWSGSVTRPQHVPVQSALGPRPLTQPPSPTWTPPSEPQAASPARQEEEAEDKESLCPGEEC